MWLSIETTAATTNLDSGASPRRQPTMATKRPHSAMNAQAEDEDPIDPSDELMFLALGGGNEVGRSCHIIQYKGKTVMLDAGIHPSYEGLGALPFYDEFDLSTVDLLLITHFHQDHSASLPYVLSKTNFAGRVYMTHPTKAIYKWTTQDAVRVHNTHTPASSSSGTDGYVSQLYTEQDILSTMPMIQTISFHTTHSHNGIRFTPYPAGHVLGACMYLIEIAGLNILFTGDYSRETDRHLIPATVPRNVKVDCLITESTFGISTRTPRQERENALIKSITTILNRGGRVLMPTTAVGNTQELLLILEDYWQRHEEYRKFPIYYASGLARKVMVVYQTYVDDMNDTIKAKFQASAVGQSVGEGGTAGPWDFQFVRALKGIDRFEDVGGSVVLASPGMLQNGPSRALLERWAPEAKNGVVITGYSVEGTMAKTILMEPDEIPAVTQNRSGNMPSMGKRGGVEGEKQMIRRRCTVQEFNFAVHVDGQENREFIEEIGAPVVILVHGEKHNMNRLKSRLLGIGKMKVYSPANCEEVRIPFRQEKVARVVGRLASQIQPPTLLPSPPDSTGEGGDVEEGEVKRWKAEHDSSLGQVISGVLVQNDFKLSLMAPEDLKEYAGLATTRLVCRQHITLASASPDLIKWALEGTFGSITTVSCDLNGSNAETNGSDEGAGEEVQRREKAIFEIMGGAVRVICKEHGVTELEWEGNATNDGIADAVMAVLLTVETSPAAIKRSSQLHSHSHEEDVQDYDGFGDSAGGEKKAKEAFPRRNPHANTTPEDRLNRLFMFLEAQFGEESISAIAKPRLRGVEPTSNGEVDAEEADEVDAVDIEKKEANELARLHGLGIPVPGLEIKVDKSVAKVWLERVEVECANKTFGERAGMDRKSMTPSYARKRQRSISPPRVRSPRKAAKVEERCVRLPSGARLNFLSSAIQDTQASQKPPAASTAISAMKQNIKTEGAGGDETDSKMTTDARPPASLQYPHGVVKKTWAFDHPRTGHDIKLEEVLEPTSLRTAVLSAFQWDVDWLLRKLNTPLRGGSTKCIFVMQAKHESDRDKWREDASHMSHFLRLCFPDMSGLVNCMHSKLMLLFHPHKLRIAIPTANLLNFDWGETGQMENSVFLIDLPRLSHMTKTTLEHLPPFGRELMYFIQKQGLDQDLRDGVLKFDFSPTTDMAFVHTVGGMNFEHDAARTGLLGLGNAIRELGLSTGSDLEIDFAASSIGMLNEAQVNDLHTAARGIDLIAHAKNARSKAGADFFKKKQMSSPAEIPSAARRSVRIYFPTAETVRASTAGAAGTICLQRRYFEGKSFPRDIFRDYTSTRKGLLSHNKILCARSRNNVAWVYVGSANMSKSAWGELGAKREENKITCRNWECGVILPVARNVTKEKVKDENGDEETDDDEGEPDEKQLVGMDAFANVIDLPFEVPGEEYGDREPWYFTE
ncbi:hypothetical protein AC579_10037 [Pseudocercospora musae]|uniref:Metallo-beta-lactamase domain-containing protein n=1 Tax=Pseudocercospora musae TaxID=113226 RepID=A0A139IHH7_9PEZI|nr:hypothetical protein AC579_10037 [Pseudocercospora musae]